jgi:hypothetical protein
MRPFLALGDFLGWFTYGGARVEKNFPEFPENFLNLG